MQPIAPDYVAPENDIENIEDGIYTPESISFMEKSIDKATNKPCLTDAKFGPVVMLNLSIQGNDDLSVPLSTRINEIPYMVQAFTKKAGELLPPVPALDQLAAIENYLILAVQLCNEGTQRPNIVVKKGWGSVYRLTGSSIPQSDYHGYFTDISSKNELGLPSALASDRYPDQYQFDALFLIVADRYGEQCGWSGVSHFQKFIRYAATADTDEKGQLKADWIRIKKGKDKGKYTKNAINFSRFVGTTAPSLFPTEPGMEPRFVDPKNICPEWIMTVQMDRVLLHLSISINPKGYSVLDIAKISAADVSKLRFDVDASVPVPVVQVPPPSNGSGLVQETEPKIQVEHHLQVLCDLFNVILDGGDNEFSVPFLKPKELTSIQLSVVMSLLKGIKEKLSTSKLNELSLVDVGLIFEELPFEDLGQEKVEKIAEIYARLEINEEDIPF